jgi:hypothetical protein
MPIHDWSIVEPTIYHHFHQAWSLTICNTLNSGLLPPGYSALVEQYAAGVVPDVVTLQGKGSGSGKPMRSGGVVVTATPKARHVIRSQAILLGRRANRVAIHHALGDVVCVIEIVSPGNKAGAMALQAFVDKSTELLRQGVHLLVIDLFPPTPRDPQGIHRAIWDRVEPNEFTLPDDKPLTLAAYVSDDPLTAFVEPVALGDTLPDMPAYLDTGAYVPVPLEATYQATWDSCPEAMREVVLQGRASA